MATPLYTFDYYGSTIETYGTYSVVDGKTSTGFLYYVKSGNLIIVDKNLNPVAGDIFAYYSDGKSYIAILTADGKIVSLGNVDIAAFLDGFVNNEIASLTSNITSDSSTFTVTYTNGSIVGYDVITGKEVFRTGQTAKTGVAEYVTGYISNMLGSLTNTSYSTGRQSADSLIAQMEANGLSMSDLADAGVFDDKDTLEGYIEGDYSVSSSGAGGSGDGSGSGNGNGDGITDGIGNGNGNGDESGSESMDGTGDGIGNGGVDKKSAEENKTEAEIYEGPIGGTFIRSTDVAENPFAVPGEGSGAASGEAGNESLFGELWVIDPSLTYGEQKDKLKAENGTETGTEENSASYEGGFSWFGVGGNNDINTEESSDALINDNYSDSSVQGESGGQSYGETNTGSAGSFEDGYASYDDTGSLTEISGNQDIAAYNNLGGKSGAGAASSRIMPGTAGGQTEALQQADTPVNASGKDTGEALSGVSEEASNAASHEALNGNSEKASDEALEEAADKTTEEYAGHDAEQQVTDKTKEDTQSMQDGKESFSLQMTSAREEYTAVYNPETESFEIYSVSELMANPEKAESESSKISEQQALIIKELLSAGEDKTEGRGFGFYGVAVGAILVLLIVSRIVIGRVFKRPA